ncbi:tol-Pal system protein TolA-like isoform X1 [Danaus plexippus]|uniref:tol-Pal system protein TolA-like isoform X1 n=1 Tax=Danaus plexippus TaxID=13037 RepID=UPI002AB20A59|nr:tol-Pal system protein TolA-like isoform X1 [Danaus plexippus]XP_061379930.1 tol-Pal system protein TolA-like isoform X1 [Danaus plexippus]
MRAFTIVLLCVGALASASSAPINQNSAQRAEYNYDYEGDQTNQAKDPAEAASHYDSYIQDVKAAANGGGGKKGFSRGSGLRTIAVGSANQAKTALGNQQAAAYQAAYVAKNTLAQSAAQSSATAQAALAGKQVILSGLEQQVRDAKVGLQGEEMQLQQAKRAAQSAAQAAQQAMHQVNVIQAALNAAQATSENANEAASQAAGELGAQTAMVGAARQRLSTLQEQLKGVRIDFEATQAAARKAQAAAQQAQANAAEAAAKAAAAGLAANKPDASHEGSGPNQDPVTLHATRRSKPIQNIKTLTLNLSQNPGQWHKQKPPVQFHEPLKISKTKRIKLLDSESFEKFPTFADGGYILNSEPEFKW